MIEGTAQCRLTIRPVRFQDAVAYVVQHHRHHQPPQGHKFSLGCFDEQGALRGVAIVGRPVARGLDDGLSLEITRVATDGCPNSCSALLAAARRSAKALGYLRILTYTLQDEPGTSLKAAGFVRTKEVAGARSWSSPTRPRVDRHPLVPKQRWEGWAPTVMSP